MTRNNRRPFFQTWGQGQAPAPRPANPGKKKTYFKEKVMLAYWEMDCTGCHQKIDRGDRIRFVNRKQVAHYSCPVTVRRSAD